MEWLFFYLAAAVVVGVIASEYGRTGFAWFVGAVLLSPLLMGILVLALGRVKRPDPLREVIAAQTHTRCPACKEIVRRDALKCKHCGGELTPSST